MIALLTRKLPQTFVLCMEDADLQTFTNYSLSSGNCEKENERKWRTFRFPFCGPLLSVSPPLGDFFSHKEGIFHSNLQATKVRRFLALDQLATTQQPVGIQ